MKGWCCFNINPDKCLTCLFKYRYLTSCRIYWRIIFQQRLTRSTHCKLINCAESLTYLWHNLSRIKSLMVRDAWCRCCCWFKETIDWLMFNAASTNVCLSKCLSTFINCLKWSDCVQIVYHCSQIIKEIENCLRKDSHLSFKWHGIWTYCGH